MSNKKSNIIFFFKSFIAGIIGSNALYYYWGIENKTIDLLLINFHYFLGQTIIFWIWLGKELSIRGWLRAGFVGAVIYSLVLVGSTSVAEQIAGKPFQSLTVDLVFIFIHVFAGGIASLPQWFISRKVLSNSYQWIIVNALGYGFLRLTYWLSVYSYENDLFSFRQFIQNMSDVQWFNNISHAFRYGILGLILSIAFFNFIKTKSTEVSE